ncbi:MAG: MATE family efflux transporter [Bacteroidales bacterium]|nr:MATE family efflux transporter [Bacteroidales bacterium]
MWLLSNLTAFSIDFYFSGMFFNKYFISGYNKPGGIRDLLDIAFPMMISTACDGVMTFTDRLFLARLGSEQMNAALGGGITYQMLMFFFVGLTGYSTALVAQYYGAGQWKNSPRASFQAILVTLAAWPVILLLKPLAVSFYYTMDIPVNQVAYQIQYLNILAWGGLFGMLRQTISCYFTGIGQPKIVMIATITAMLVNVVLDYILIFGKLGLPVMGVKGAALATVCGGFSAMFILLIAYFHPFNRVNFGVMKSFHFDWTMMKKLIHFGYPAGLEMFLNFMAFFFMTLMFQSRGESEATATSIMFNWDLVSYIPLLGIEIAVTSLVGRYMGAGRPQVAHRAAISAVKTGMVYSLVVLVLFLAIPEALVRVFHPQNPSSIFENAVPMAISMVRIASLYVLAQAVIVALIGALRGAGDTFYTMVVSVVFNWVFLPLLYLSFYVFDRSVSFGWLVVVLSYLVFCYFIYLRFRTGKWKNLRVIQ